MDKNEFMARTRDLALQILNFVKDTQKNEMTRVLNYQIIKSGTSIGANYRAACRGRSKAEFIAKMGIVEEEADETLYWLDLYKESGVANSKDIEAISKETNEILSMVVSPSILPEKIIRNLQSEIRNRLL